MDTGVSLGRAAHRRLWEVVREVAGDNLEQGGKLVTLLRDRGAVRLDPGAFTEFDSRQAKACLRDFLGPRAYDFMLPPDLVPESAQAELNIWETADLPLPLRSSWTARPAWLAKLLERKLVRCSPRGMTLSPRLRIHLWLSHDSTDPAKLRRSSLLWETLRTLRRLGRWHEAARWAHVVSEASPELVDRNPSLSITIALGYAQSQNYAWLSRWFTTLREAGHSVRVLAHPMWKARLEALEAFVDLERGEHRNPGYHPKGEGHFWYALVRCWSALYVGRYRRALRLLEFIDNKRSRRLAWLEVVILAWRAAALHYLERYSESQECNLLALQSAERLGWRERELVMLRNLALALFETGEVEQSLAILKGLANRHMLEHRPSELPSVYNLEALILNMRIRLGTGAWVNVRAQHLGLQAEVMHHFLYFMEGQAVRARRSGQDQISERLSLEVEQLGARIGDSLARGNAVWNRARLAWCRLEAEGAFSLLAQAEDLFSEMNQITRRADMSCDRALFYLEQGHLELADQQIHTAEHLYGTEIKHREAALLELLKLELLLRRSPERFEESHLDLIVQAREDTTTRSAYAYAIVALGFAVLEDDFSSMKYGKEGLSRVNRLLDPFITGHILALGRFLRNHSRTTDELVSYWLETFPFQEDSG